MSAHDGHTGFACDVRSSTDDLLDQSVAKKGSRKRQQVQDEEWLGTHSVDVRKCVGGRDPSEVVRVVDHGREEIECDHQCPTVPESIHGGVVAGGGIHQRLLALEGNQMTQDLRQLGHAEFTRSPSSVGKLGQADPGLLISGLLCHFAQRASMGSGGT